jgi:hypothetical protein
LSGDAVGEHERRQRRRTVWLAGQVGEAAHCFGQGPVTGAIALGPPCPIAGDVEHHDARMASVHGLVVDAPTFERAGTVADDEDVTDREQLVEQLLSC